MDRYFNRCNIWLGLQCMSHLIPCVCVCVSLMLQQWWTECSGVSGIHVGEVRLLFMITGEKVKEKLCVELSVVFVFNWQILFTQICVSHTEECVFKMMIIGTQKNTCKLIYWQDLWRITSFFIHICNMLFGFFLQIHAGVYANRVILHL